MNSTVIALLLLSSLNALPERPASQPQEITAQVRQGRAPLVASVGNPTIGCDTDLAGRKASLRKTRMTRAEMRADQRIASLQGTAGR